MPRRPLPIVGGAYADEARPWSQQDCVNYLPTSAEKAGTRSEAMLKTPPGLRPLVELPVTGTVRGLHEAEGRLFAAISGQLYRISNAGIAIPLGAVPGVGRVVMDHNQISLGNEVMAVNGSAGYLHNTVTDTFERITDTGFPGGSVVKFIDGFFVVVEPQGRFAQNSAPANGLEWNTLDRFTSEVKPDRLVSLAAPSGELMLLSASSCEFFQNTGASEQPFRSKRISLDKGCAGAYVVAEADNTVFWLGSEGVFYQLEGYAARRISTRPIEQAIRGLNWSQAYAFVWEDAGHTVIYWTFPDGRTWGYDVSEREWHRRESYGLNRWRVSATAYWRNQWVAGDFQKPRLWTLDWDYPWEGDVEFVSERTLPVLHAEQARVFHHRLEVVMDTGQPAVETVAFPAQPDPPTITGDAPDGFVDVPYSFTYTLADGTPPYIVTLRDGTLPAGLSLSAAGVISGTPTADATASITVRVTDSFGLWDEVTDTIEVTTEPLPALVSDVNAYTGTPDALTSLGAMGWVNAINTVRVSPDGIYAAGGVNGSLAAGRLEIRKYDPGAGTWSALPNPADYPTGWPDAFAWSPDGNYLAMTVGNGLSSERIWIYKRTGDTFTRLAAPISGLPNSAARWALAWNADGSALAVGNAASADGVYVWDFVGETLINRRNLSGTGTNFIGGAPYRFDWNGTQLACYNGTAVFIVDTTQDPMPVMGSATTDVGVGVSAGVFWAADTDYLVAVDSDWVYTLSWNGTDTLTVIDSDQILGAGASDSSVSPDRRYIAAAVGDIEIVDLGSGAVPSPTVLGNLSASSVQSVSFSERA